MSGRKCTTPSGVAQADPQECLFVDDLPENVEAAGRHGWKGVCYQQRGRLAEQLRAAGVVIG